MAATFVVKIEYEGVLRRINLDGAGDHLFLVSHIQNRARELFKLPDDTEAEFTYIDSEGDAVALADDHDVDDALFLQGLNPLRITMVTKTPATAIKTSSFVPPSSSGSGSGWSSRSSSLEADYQLPSSIDDVITSATLSAAPDSPKTAASKATLGDIEDLKWGAWSNQSRHENWLPLPVAGSGLGPASSLLEGAAAARRDSSGATTEAEAKKGAEGEEKEKEELEDGEEEEGSVQNAADVGNAVPFAATTPMPTPTPAEAEGDDDDTHWGVQCNGCLTLPIKGPRFKSCKKSNYDLCSRCFALVDGVAEHTEFVRLTRRFHRLGDPANSGVTMRSFKLRRLLSSLLQSAKIVPSSLADSSSESGKPLFRWPAKKAGAQCDECGRTPIEGSRYKSRTRFNYDLCQGCFERSGSDDQEYARVVVVPTAISAFPPVASLARQTYIGVGEFASAFPPVGLTWPPFTKVMSLAEGQCQRVGALCERVISGISAWKSIDSFDFAVGDDEKVSTPVPGADVKGVAAAEATVESQPEASNQIREGEVPYANVASSSSAAAPPPAAAAATLPVGEEGGLPELLVKLGDMGFKDEALNTEVLERNNLNLPKTLDDLCEKEDWDPILEELEEMGFYDTDMNRRLMIQKQGSVKQVLKELVRVARGDGHA